MVFRLFPHLDNKVEVSRLKIDDESVHFISVREYAKKITLIIDHHLRQLNINSKCAIITDATAGVGGNVISFGMYFKRVNAIEINKQRVEYLENNVKVYNLENINIINKDSTVILNKINDHDVVFIDPPWGGKEYKNHRHLKLCLSNVPIEEICNNLFNDDKTNKHPKMIVLKLPVNYDIKFLYDNIASESIFFHDLKKMFILVIINPFITT